MNATVADPLVGQMLDGRYLVRSRVARGGMATVYAGHDTKLDRTVALKVMHANLAGDEDFVRRFIGEAKHAAALSHPNVVAMYDQGTDKGHVFLAMEYVPGRTLRDLLTERGRLGPREALEIMQPVLAALGTAHHAGLIHRDIKPENVLLTGDGQVKVADFGLARAESASKQTKTGMLIGTVGYLAPEQVLSGDADARTDVYAAGIMLFELLTGRQPHQAGTPLAVAYKHVNEAVPLPSSVVPGLPTQLDALVASATNRDPDRRPSDAAHFHAAVSEIYRMLPPDIDARLAGVAPLPPPETHPDGATQALRTPVPPVFGPPDSTRTFNPHTMAIPRDEPSPALTPRDRLTRPPGLYGLIAGCLAVVVLLGTVVWFQTVGKTQRVPTMAGLSEHEARIQAEELGLKVRIGPSRYDAHAPKDTVAEVRPKAGTEVKKGTLLTLILSKGKQPVIVPDVRGKPLDQARQLLRQAGLQPGDVVRLDSTTVPRDMVIRTRPAANAKRSPDDPVTLVVSNGIKMPDLKGMPRDQAAQLLAKLGVNAQWQEQDPADGQPENTVIGQTPPAGQYLNRGDNVQVIVTKGKCEFWNPFCKKDGESNGAPVPNVVGQPITTAGTVLTSAGFKVNVRGGQPGEAVTGQDPPAGTPQPPGAVITIWH